MPPASFESKLQRFYQELPLNHLKRVQMLNAIAPLKECFHRAIPNNYSFLYVPRSKDLELQLGRLTSMHAKLNKFGTHLRSILSERHLSTFTSTEEKQLLICKELSEWESAIVRQDNFLGAGHLEKIARACDKGLSIPFEEIKTVFSKIDWELMAFLRVSFAVSDTSISRLMHHVITCTSENPIITSLLDRVEIAKSSINERTALSPSLSLFFHEPTNKEQLNAIHRLAFAITEDAAFFGLTLTQDFTDSLSEHCSVGQGYNSVKKISATLGFIDRYYDSRSKYAFTNASLKNWGNAVSK